MDNNDAFSAVVISIIAAVVSLFILFFVIKYAVLSALREHTTSSTTAVSVVSANPLPVLVDVNAHPKPKLEQQS